MGTNLKYADSIVVRLLADYMIVFYMKDLEMFTVYEPKMAVVHLTNVLLKKFRKN